MTDPLDVLLAGLPCRIGFRRSWRCVRHAHTTGPCALVPRWWNWTESARRFRFGHLDRWW